MTPVELLRLQGPEDHAELPTVALHDALVSFREDLEEVKEVMRQRVDKLSI